jgi:hypothetical protein
MNPRLAWWIHPGKLALFFLLPIYVFIVYVVPVRWPHLVVLRGACFLLGGYAATGLVMLALFGLGGLIGGRLAFDQAGRRAYRVQPWKLALVGALTILAYVIWFFPLLHGRIPSSRDDLNQTPGITSFTQAGVPFVLCYLHCRFSSGQLFPPYVRWEVWLVVLLTLARVFLWMERLAAIELAVPALVLILTQTNARGAFRRARHIIVAVGPYLGLPALLAAFTVTEYFRSWETYSQTQRLSLLDFMTSRVTTYYYTALNNGAGLLTTRSDEWPSYRFLYTADWFYRLPGGVGETFRRLFMDHGEHPTGLFLGSYADPEFNNMSGIFPMMYDLGTVGAGVYFVVFGVVAGMLYRSMMRGGKVGALLYPPVFVGCLEIFRTAYLNGPRVVLLFAGALFLLSQMRAVRSAGPRRPSTMTA